VGRPVSDADWRRPAVDAARPTSGPLSPRWRLPDVADGPIWGRPVASTPAAAGPSRCAVDAPSGTASCRRAVATPHGALSTHPVAPRRVVGRLPPPAGGAPLATPVGGAGQRRFSRPSAWSARPHPPPSSSDAAASRLAARRCCHHPRSVSLRRVHAASGGARLGSRVRGGLSRPTPCTSFRPIDAHSTPCRLHRAPAPRESGVGGCGGSATSLAAGATAALGGRHRGPPPGQWPRMGGRRRGCGGTRRRKPPPARDGDVSRPAAAVTLSTAAAVVAAAASVTVTGARRVPTRLVPAGGIARRGSTARPSLAELGGATRARAT